MAELVIKEMSDQQFRNIVRAARTTGLDRVTQMEMFTRSTLERLNKERDLTKAATSTPDGSNSLDIMSFKVWMDRVGVDDAAAIDQILTIDATLANRLA